MRSFLLALLFSAYVRRRIGGLTGDTLGAACELDRTRPRPRRVGLAVTEAAHDGTPRRKSAETCAGRGRAVGEILDFSANINPLGPPEWFRPLISARIGELVHYPDPDCTELVGAFCARYGVSADEILMGNGSTELLFLLPQVLRKRRAR